MEEKRKVIGKPFQPGNKGGRAKGTPNKLTSTVKETVLSVFQKLQEDPKHNLTKFAEKYPRDFYNIAAKLIPTEISGAIKHVTINVIEPKEGE